MRSHPPKLPVTRPFAYIEGSLLNGRTFTSLEHLTVIAAQWLAHTADVRFHQEINARPIDRFQEEKSTCSLSLSTHTPRLRFCTGP